MLFPEKLHKKFKNREKSNALRKLSEQKTLIDFSSNDYLGFTSSKEIFNGTHRLLIEKTIQKNGATGSRLLSGNHKLYVETEKMLADFHNAEEALIFNSGYDANVGFFSSVPQRGDVIFYDELIHASIRDGMQMSNAKSYKFKHNDIEDLKFQIERNQKERSDQEIYIVTESVFSMDGDCPDLKSLIAFCQKYSYHLIVDEAHATGVFGDYGVGLLQKLGIEDQVFARINTFGKALGCHGAVVLGSKDLKTYLVNFCRSFIYTTGLPPHSIATIKMAYEELQRTPEIKKLIENITFFTQELKSKHLTSRFIKSNSAIHCCIISGNENVKKVANEIQKKGFDVKPILSPTVPQGKERLRFCLHSYNSKEEISEVLELLATFVRI
ncbi:8-amino-7-oxononanoate synthase [Aquimarina sp. MAR_2010_214]|uniref:aminotransferase class I/II-fold pyridoxal phosphate-dependent enzyme n=1 Tax=Aquimarina sp. MAR_2010_214 TaxID=1250026 RepID=UPI000C702426|nr:pyridoxal phosphate-dependent aminotransferase family protein [Aquimarina sp. MAR_2010_214]PKV48462.1 8-amino-7-oxononanoate synthase [Aquimarina sp. MAR_2010_214]